jgi:hypothetical protein
VFGTDAGVARLRVQRDDGPGERLLERKLDAGAVELFFECQG